MIKIHCDRCKRILSDSQAWVWHRRLPHDEGTAHFDLCVNCDADVMAVIHMRTEVDVS
jgi:hypothetical protein